MMMLKPMFVYIAIATFLTLLPWNASFGQSLGEKLPNQTENLTTQGEEKIVARIGTETIGAADLKSYLFYRPLPRRDLAMEEAIKERLDEMIVGELLYQEGLRLNIHRDPQVRRQIQQIVGQKLLENNIDREVWTKPIKEQALQAYYNEHKYEFDHPEQVRLADIFVAVPPGATKKQRSEKKKKAESALAEAVKTKDKRFEFGALIRKYSDTHKKYPLGDTGYFDSKGNPLELNNTLVEEAFKLKGIGQVCDHVIETPDGYHVIMLVAKRPAVRRRLDEVKNELKQRIRREKLQNARQCYIQGLKKKAEIHIDDQVLAEVLKELKEVHKTQPAAVKKKMPPRPGRIRTPPPFPGQH